MIFKSFFKPKLRIPKNTIGFDFKNLNRDEYSEKIMFDDFKYDFSEKVYRLNRLKLFKLNNAVNVINEYKSLEKEIWG